MSSSQKVSPRRRLSAGVLALCLIFTNTYTVARGTRMGAGLADLLDMDLDVPLPAAANLPANLVPGLDFESPIAGDPPPSLIFNATAAGPAPITGSTPTAAIAPIIPGAPATIQLLPSVLSSNGQWVTPLGGIAGDGILNGQASQPGVLTPLGPSVLPPLISLKDVPLPTVRGIEQFVINPAVAVLLGKALFWDAQVGSDGQACASCHFHAGADNRLKNQLNPGLRSVPGDIKFNPTFTGTGGPNYTLKAGDFPFHRLANPVDRNSAVMFDSNDVVSSQGTFGGPFKTLFPSGIEKCGNRPDDASDTFKVNGLLTRRVAPRNTPSVINAVFNFRNFWDGRANNVFNGVNPFGNRDPNATVLQRQPSGLAVPVRIAVANASLASQAVGPALSDFEMSCANKSFKDLGRKLLDLRPLAQQTIDAKDSVLGIDRHPTSHGLKMKYAELIKKAFDPQWWNATGSVGGYTQMENNFSLFWGLAIMAYESTLVSDEAPIDKFIGYQGQLPDLAALSAQDLRGMEIFRGKAGCVSCHKGAEYTSAASSLQSAAGDAVLVEHMFGSDGKLAIYDSGFYNIGVRPTSDDVGVGGGDPFGNSLSFSREYLAQLKGRVIPDQLRVDPCRFAVFVDSLVCSLPPDPALARVSVDGAFKTPSLRNIALTQPYFHNGSRFTLDQVVEFYNRGGDRRGLDSSDTTGFSGPDATSGGATNAHPAIHPLGLTQLEQTDLVAFLRHALTDRRVACERAPFDHPSLNLLNGHTGNNVKVADVNRDGMADDDFMLLPAVGAAGLPADQCMHNDDGSL